MHNLSRAPRITRVRWHAEQPPTPLGCRWCGHPPYAHDAATLPHRPGHQWEQPTNPQVRARMAVRRHLGLCDRPFPGTAKPVTARSPRFHPPAPPVSRGHQARPPVTAAGPQPAVATAVPYGREISQRRRGTPQPQHGPETTYGPGTSYGLGTPYGRESTPGTRRLPSSRREPYRVGAAR
ncbi:hypothetical protein OHA77_23850 [Streptosporangium sp. NBC_01639]|uniref:hypothetical protein n=1 Tax=Streptosporangium sp. NBC_01639 TaxID=2975948 RepID=UPI00386D9FFD|nr:hypothetical protein OHA77_23850 [Streptosporangium sp. NBC_01639]